MNRTPSVLAIFAAFTFVQQGVAFQTLLYPGSLNTIAIGISGNKIVGTYWDTSSAMQHGFIYEAGIFSSLDVPGSRSTVLKGIDGDRIVGGYLNTRSFGFAYEAGTFTTIEPPGTDPTSGNGSVANGLSSGKVVGQYFDGSTTRGFLFDGTAYSTLDHPAGTIQYADDIDGSVIVGRYSSAGVFSRGYILDGTNLTSLDFPGAGPLGTSAYGLSGTRVVGQFVDSSLRSHGMIYQAGQYASFDVARELGKDTTIYGIFGDTIVGTYIDASGRYRGFVETIPEPFSIELVSLSLAACLVYRRRTTARRMSVARRLID